MTTSAEQVVTLENLASGGAVELFEHELQRVLDNIADANTKATAERVITMKVHIKPTETRTAAAVAVEVSSKMAGMRPVDTTMYFGRKDGRLVATTYDPRQSELFKGSEDVMPIGKTAKGAEQ